MQLFPGFGTSAEDIEHAIAQLLPRLGIDDVSRVSCKSWARAFVHTHHPQWRPGTPLPIVTRQRIGAAFMDLLAQHQLLKL